MTTEIPIKSSRQRAAASPFRESVPTLPETVPQEPHELEGVLGSASSSRMVPETPALAFAARFGIGHDAGEEPGEDEAVEGCHAQPVEAAPQAPGPELGGLDDARPGGIPG